MTAAKSVGEQKPTHAHSGDSLPTEVRRLLNTTVDLQHTRTRAERDDLKQVLVEAVRSRELRELADLDVRRSICRLADHNVPQRDIAAIVGISQPEVSRRLKRRSLSPEEPSPREIILRRAVGLLTTQQMMDELRGMAMTSKIPEQAARFDGGATSVGSAQQLVAALRDGLLEKGEYEELRKSVRVTRTRHPGLRHN